MPEPAAVTPRAPAPVRPRTAAVVVASDRRARGEGVDRSGVVLVEGLRDAGWSCGDAVVVPDGVESVRAAVRDAADAGAAVVLTSGGTGVGPRDLTPEATAPLLARELPGVAEALRRAGAAHVPTAILSRGLAGVTAGGVVVVNLPGSPGGARDGLAVLLPVLDHLTAQLAGGDHDDSPAPPAGADQHGGHGGHAAHDRHDRHHGTHGSGGGAHP
ncbi:molybdenum cofactor synthesis domain-containing protein [Cellulomonas marina]|uniref:Molybdenum cofactor synthesis domain-containing protein n=1 Tax=Cellulomonas marina TaxID=988821 RepID=A0A1I1ACG0_9CELL|nr:molybdenum cofactor synthesis domain-containing protein [Cellulomonas marina]GIG29737.1 molybdenum cofactor biosynthesis protein [Cellulomonas marina]SFB35701.1 molybdenum cofactor synthesis domain-containing protein [Cellulomonas marina]